MPFVGQGDDGVCVAGRVKVAGGGWREPAGTALPSGAVAEYELGAFIQPQ